VRRALGALPPGGQLVAIVATLIVAGGAGLLSWDANTWAAGEIGIDPWYRWVYGIVIDGAIAAPTAGVFVLQGRRRAVAWSVLLGALAVSLVGNGAHAHPGSWLHTVGSMVPALLLAVCLLIVELIVRAPAPAASARTTPRVRAARAPRRARRSQTPAGARLGDARGRVRVLVDAAKREGDPLPTGQQLAEAVGVHPGHARRLRAQAAGNV
jgi:hypothetical protein